MRALPGGFLSPHGPMFQPRAGRTRITRGLNEEGLRRGSDLSLGPLITSSDLCLAQ